MCPELKTLFSTHFLSVASLPHLTLVGSLVLNFLSTLLGHIQETVGHENKMSASLVEHCAASDFGFGVATINDESRLTKYKLLAKYKLFDTRSYTMKLSNVLRDLGPTVAYNPRLVKVLGSVNAVLFFCQLSYWTGQGADPNGWIYKTMSEWEDETGLTNEQQEVARKKLKAIGVLEEKHLRGSINKKYYRINMELLLRIWDDFLESDNFRIRKTRLPKEKKDSLESVKYGLPSPRSTDSVNREARTPLHILEKTAEEYRQVRDKKSRTQSPSSTKIDFDSNDKSSKSSIRFQTEHFFAICKACDIDLDLATTKTKDQAAKVAEVLQSKGYTSQDIETARNRWAMPLSPTPLQFQDKFLSLLNHNPSAYSNGYQTAAERRARAWEEHEALYKTKDSVLE